MAQSLLNPDCLDTGFDDFLHDLLGRVYAVSHADLAVLEIYPRGEGDKTRYLSFGDDTGRLLGLAKSLVTSGTGSGVPLIFPCLLGANVAAFPELPRLRKEGIEAVLVYLLQISPDKPLGRVVVLSTTKLEETLKNFNYSLLEAFAVQLTLVIEAHNRLEDIQFLELRRANHAHRLRSHLTHLCGRLGALRTDFPQDERLNRYVAELETFGKLTRLFEDPRRYFSDFPLSYLVESIAIETIKAFGAEDRVSWGIAGESVPNLNLRQLEAMAAAIGELTTNSLKYAWPRDEVGEIHVTLEEEKDERGCTWVVVRYADNGCDLPAEFDPGTTKGTGLRMVGVILQAIDGTISLCEKPLTMQLMHGFSATIRFKK